MILKKAPVYAGLIVMCCLGFQNPAYAMHGTRTEAKYRANLWISYFPTSQLPANFGGENPQVAVSVSAVTARYDVKVVERQDDGQAAQRGKTVTALVHPDTHGTEKAFIEVAPPCLMGCFSGVRRIPNTQHQTVTLEVVQVVKKSCADCRTKFRGRTSPDLVVSNLRKEPFADYSVTYNWKQPAPVCDVVRKVIDLNTTKSESAFQVEATFGTCSLQDVIHHSFQLRPLEATTYDLSESGEVVPNSGRKAEQADVERIQQSLINSTPYQNLVQNPGMPSCSAAKNDPQTICYQDELLGTDCSTAIYQVKVAEVSGAQAAGVLLIPCDAPAILLYENLAVYQQVTLAAANSGLDLTGSFFWQPKDDLTRESMKQAGKNLIQQEDIISQEEKMRNLQGRVGTGGFDKFSAGQGSQIPVFEMKSLFQ